MTHKLYSNEDIAKVREALEADCGGRCNAEHNPCSAREAIAILYAGKDVSVIGQAKHVMGSEYYFDFDPPTKYEQSLGWKPVYAATDKVKV